jgi:hypothetical protein
MTAPTWSVGQTWWLGSSCLVCVGIDRHGSHQSEEIARYDAATRSSACPRCGCQLVWSSAPSVHDLPWCQVCSDLPARRAEVEAIRAEWDDARYDAGYERAPNGPLHRRERALRNKLHDAEDTCEEIADAIAAREWANDDCPPTLRAI